ncbi:MAG: hypothetical protein PVG70_08325 [Desulfobacterales bacterium]
MLNDEERERIYCHAYLPEHLPDYVQAVSGGEPFLHRNYLYFLGKKHLIFNGYPLETDSDPPALVYEAVCERFQPSTVAVISPEIWLPSDQYDKKSTDSYYRLDLPPAHIDSAVAYMVRRSQRELKISRGHFGKEHKKIVKGFLSTHHLTREQKHLFKQIPQYLKSSTSAILLEARKRVDLVAYSIMDIGSADYAFYLFNFRSRKVDVPGASDLLFSEMISLAHAEGKKTINLGLGINDGIRRFKEKWGGAPFLSYASALVYREPVALGRLANKL